MIGKLVPKRIEPHVAPGVHLIADGAVNWYLVEEEGALTIVDCGLPRSWELLGEALARIGRRREDLKAVVLTHAHWDHVGFARQAKEQLGLPIYATAEETELARHPYRYDKERSPLPYLAIPKAMPIVAQLIGAGAYKVKGVEVDHVIRPGETLDVPGHPVVLDTRGHTHGHCALHLPDRSAVIVGDALVMLDPYTGRHGPCLVARAATADVARAKQSLDVIAATGAEVLLSGHGEPYRGPASQAAEQARANGAA
jgi:glyoxylase-like metal-dependent hydrolase (beta-lactamase superfamily II)